MMLEKLIEQARSAPAGDLPSFIGQLESAKAVAYSRLQAPTPTVRPDDQLLDVNAAAARLCVSRGYLFRNHKTLPFTRRVGRGLLFSSLGITEYINQKGANRR
ncbi:MAG: hypothetical protein ACLP0H_19810 [Terriglobales bacterium]